MPSSEAWTIFKHQMIACSLAFVTGYTDVISVTRWKVFATMMTGNVVFLGRSITPEEATSTVQSAQYYLSVMLTFFFGALTYRLAESRWPNRGASTLGVPFGIMMFCAELLLKMGWAPRCHELYPLTVLAYAPMFGVLNAACAAGQLATSTTLATGHLVTFANAAAKFCQRQKVASAEKRKVMMSIGVLLSIFGGAILGGLVYWHSSKAGNHGALLPVAPTLALLFWLHDHLAKPRRLMKKLSKLRKGSADKAEAEANDDESSAEGDEDFPVDLEMAGGSPQMDAAPDATTSEAGPEERAGNTTSKPASGAA